jgi:hypothetical protein
VREGPRGKGGQDKAGQSRSGRRGAGARRTSGWLPSASGGAVVSATFISRNCGVPSGDPPDCSCFFMTSCTGRRERGQRGQGKGTSRGSLGRGSLVCLTRTQ